MATETTTTTAATETATETTEATTESHDQTDSTASTQSPAESQEVLVFQGITPPSEEELSGFDPESKPEVESEESTEESEGQTDVTQESSTTDQAAEESEEEDDSDHEEEEEDDASEYEEADEDVKPPKGYVPLKALHEARGEMRYLKEQIADLTRQINTKEDSQPKTKSKPELPEQFKDFKELDEKELAELVQEDPAEAILYVKKLQEFQEFQRSEQDAEKAQKQEQARIDQIAQRAYERMEQAVPDLFDQESTTGAELAKFADEIGFSNELFPLTDPRTMILVPGQTKPVPIGEGAADLVEMIADMQRLANTVGNLPSMSELQEMYADELREQIQTELLEKFKKAPPDGFQPLAGASGTETGGQDFEGKMLSPEDLARMTPQEMERYLSGR